ncbi:MAG: thioester dehydrase [Ignavibacteria bacterium]
MSQLLPEVLGVRREGDAGAVLALHLPPSLVHFPGHFPGMPILPGVAQVDWAARFGRDHLGVTGDFARVENLKFQAFLLPGTRLELSLTWDAARGRLEFSYADAQRRYSSGRIIFGDGA